MEVVDAPPRERVKGLVFSPPPTITDESSMIEALKDCSRVSPRLEDSSCRPDSRAASTDSGRLTPRHPRISFTEPPEEDLRSLCLEESMALPPMDPAAAPSTCRYSIHILLSTQAFTHRPPMLRPRVLSSGRLQASPMRERPLHAPLDPGTPTRAEAMRASMGACSDTAGFLLRTGLDIPPECDPDIVSRAHSCASMTDGSGAALHSLASGGGGELMGALRGLAQGGSQGRRLRLEADCVGERRDSAVRVGEWGFACFCLSAAVAIVSVGALVARQTAR